MKILRSWLNDWINVNDISDVDLSNAFESLGFEIDNFKQISPNYSDIVVGKVIEIYQHPNADKVRVTKVDVGSKIYEIVCGAWNFDVEAVVPVALPKSIIKDNFQIDKREIRGVQSNGMICSASELDLWDDQEGILLLDSKEKIGSDFSSIYDSNDSIWEIGVTPNRGDCMSHYGVARELSNYFDLKINDNSINLNPSIVPVLKINNGEGTKCSSYQAIEIENIKIQDSSLKIKHRLSSIDVRIINNIVDYTNYVLHDIGQPLHAFDRDKLFGTISVRNAKQKEELVTLDNQKRILDETDLVITDNDKPVALAGVMGGFDSEVTPDTKNLLIESAYFDKVSIMKTSRKLNLISDASIRFERGIDRQIQTFGLERFISLFDMDDDIIYSDIQNDSTDLTKNPLIKFHKNLINEILGIDIDDTFISKTLDSLKIPHTLTEDYLEFSSPSWRYDLERPIDIIEELAKHYGFNNFPSSLPIGNNLNNVGNYWKVRSYFIDKLSNLNFHEIQSLSFVDDSLNNLFNPELESVKVLNPIDKTQESMRTNLFSTLINTYLFNQDKHSYSGQYFEINNTYNKAKHKKYESIPNQSYNLGILLPKLLSDKDSKKNTIQDLSSLLRVLIPNVEFKKLSKPGFHKNNSYLVTLNGKPIGHMGQLSYSSQNELNIKDEIFLAEINLENLNYEHLKTTHYTPLSQYPFIKFDLSFKVSQDLLSQDLITEIKSLLKDNENQISIFDDYTSEKSRNLGIRIITRSYEKTYNDDEANEILNMIVNNLSNKFAIILNEKGI
ncbi:MAG: phenylalanine--tRNA ligase subunit beta [Candidatus Actinomarina sp.]